MKNGNTGFTKSKYLQLSELGTSYNLSFSSQLVFGNKIIALDGLRKCLLVLETNKEQRKPSIIDLAKVSAVTVRKSYGRITPGDLVSKGIEEFVERIELQFQFNDNTETFVLPFYDSKTDNKKDRAKLDRNARNWQMILSKIIGPGTDTKYKERNLGSLALLPLMART